MATAIAFLYRRGDLPEASRFSIQGPVYCADDGRPPWVQAVERLACHDYPGRIDKLISAERVQAPSFWAE